MIISDGLGDWRQLSPVLLEAWEWRRSVDAVTGGVYRLSILAGEYRDMFVYVRLRYRDLSFTGKRVLERGERWYPDSDATLIRLPSGLGVDPWAGSAHEKWIELMQRPKSGGFIHPGISVLIEEKV